MVAPHGRNRSSSTKHSARKADSISRVAPQGALPAEGGISSLAVLPLRLFLGVTFIYAALQKLSDPGFLRPGAPTYIGAQILAFSRGSPISWLLHQLIQFAMAVGILTVLTEGCIGLLVLLGLFTRPASLIGLVLNFGFFLSASWGTYPYFFGSDIVFVVCWLTLAITGPGAYALDPLIEGPMSRAFMTRNPTPFQRTLFSLLFGFNPPPEGMTVHDVGQGVSGVLPASVESSRRVVTRGEVVLGSIVTLALIALGLHPRNSARATGQLAGGAGASSGGSGSSAPQGTPTHAPGGNASIPPGARKIGNVSQLPVNTAGTVNDPKTGDPAVIIHESGSVFYAYDAVCTHAGCTVQYDPQQRLLVCPCHGGTFDPAHGAQVVAGPPPSPLTRIEMKIDAHGNIYIV